jgi:hypothetical protein
MKRGCASAVALLLSVSLLGGCVAQKMEMRQQMSASEATATFKKLGYDEWAENPFVRTEAICGAEKVHVPFSEFQHATFSLRQSKLTLLTNRQGVCSASYPFLLKDMDDANRIVAAANSLGARVTYLITMDKQGHLRHYGAQRAPSIHRPIWISNFHDASRITLIDSALVHSAKSCDTFV